jgi:diguanylate cyclase (GGDEF)-like protein
MDEYLIDLAHSHQWYRKILNIYWFTVIFSICLKVASLWMIPTHSSTNLIYYAVLYSFVLILLLGSIEILHYFKKIINDFILITVATVIAGTIIQSNPTLSIIPAILFMPLLISVLCFKKNRIFFACILSIATFLALYRINPELSINYQNEELLAVFITIIGVALFSYNIMSRGIEILHNLKTTNDAKQELLVKTIIMDKLYKTDALTELYNHKTFHEYLEKLIEQSESYGLPLQLAIIDIDNFKKVNDTFGHWVGDIILMRVAAMIRKQVTPNDFVARYGGEEFAVIFTEKTPDVSFAIIESIRQEIASIPHEELNFQITTVSVGLQSYVQGEGKESLFKGADANLYRAKKRGKNQTVCAEIDKSPM